MLSCLMQLYAYTNGPRTVSSFSFLSVSRVPNMKISVLFNRSVIPFSAARCGVVLIFLYV